MTGDLWTRRVRRTCSPTSTRRSGTERFDRLQARMAGVWDAMRLNHDDESVVVVPSITLDRAVAPAAAARPTRSGSCSCSLLLRQPRLRMIYVTSMPIAPEIVEYYLALLPGVIPSHARARLVAGRRWTTRRRAR